MSDVTKLEQLEYLQERLLAGDEFESVALLGS